MRGKNTIYMNGRHYDAVTGLAVSIEAPSSGSGHNPFAKPNSIDGVRKSTPASHKPKRTPAPHQVARKTSKSATLRRDLVKKPVSTKVEPVAKTRQRVVVEKSPSINRFASHPMAMKPSASLSKAQLHPKSSSTNHTINRIHSQVATKAPVATSPTKALSSRELKEHIIAEKLAQIDTNSAKKVSKQKNYPRLASILIASFAVIVLGGYLTYINMPNLSMRVAASQAGVNAKFPDYHPAGYSFDGPIAYSGGEVAVKFQSNTSNQNYTIRQKNSNWDSQAVLDNYVAAQSPHYMTSSEQGLTIYTYQNKAAWVNGGVLYTIEGNAPLSNEQVLRIAGSM